MKRHLSSKINEFYHVCVSFPLSVCVCSVSSCLIDLDSNSVTDAAFSVTERRRDGAAAAAAAEQCRHWLNWNNPGISAAGRVDNNNNSNNILYSSQREIKAFVRSHNEEHISIPKLSWKTDSVTHIRQYTPVTETHDAPSVSLNLICIHWLIANPKLPGLMLSLSNQNSPVSFTLRHYSGTVTKSNLVLQMLLGLNDSPSVWVIQIISVWPKMALKMFQKLVRPSHQSSLPILLIFIIIKNVGLPHFECGVSLNEWPLTAHVYN